MTTINLDDLRKMLVENECVIEFTKVNGEVREMPCTLRADLIPQKPIIEGEEPAPAKVPNPNVMSVWCTDKKEWRSFRVANLISAKVKDATS